MKIKIFVSESSAPKKPTIAAKPLTNAEMLKRRKASMKAVILSKFPSLEGKGFVRLSDRENELLDILEEEKPKGKKLQAVKAELEAVRSLLRLLPNKK
jgi:hypothetical protein